MEQLIESINETLNYKLSMSNIELYHSNLLAKVLEQYKEIPFSLLEGIVEDYASYRITSVLREKKRKDLTIELKNGDKSITVIIENKIKSLPDRVQLENYLTAKDNVYYILLSLIEPSEETLPDKWYWKSYHNLSKYYMEIIEGTESLLYSEFLEDYVLYISEISKLLCLDELDMNLKYFYLDEKVRSRLNEIGLLDLVDKMRFNKMSHKIKNQTGEVYSGRSRGNFHFGYNYEVSEFLSCGIQIEGNQYRLKINFKNGLGKSEEELKDICNTLRSENLFFIFNANQLFDTPSKKVKWNKYNNKESLDLYDYKIIKKQVTFKQLLKHIQYDIEEILKNSKIIESKVVSST